MAKKFTLTENKLRQCMMALRLAAESEDALCDAYAGLTDPQDVRWAREARASANKYRKLRAEIGKMLGVETKTTLDKVLENSVSVPVTEIKNLYSKDK